MPILENFDYLVKRNTVLCTSIINLVKFDLSIKLLYDIKVNVMYISNSYKQW